MEFDDSSTMTELSGAALHEASFMERDGVLARMIVQKRIGKTKELQAIVVQPN